MPLSNLLTRHAPITATTLSTHCFTFGDAQPLVVNIRYIIKRFICANTAYTYKLRHPPLQWRHRFIISEVSSTKSRPLIQTNYWETEQLPRKQTQSQLIILINAQTSAEKTILSAVNGEVLGIAQANAPTLAITRITDNDKVVVALLDKHCFDQNNFYSWSTTLHLYAQTKMVDPSANS
jgi:hypothetical protein